MRRKHALPRIRSGILTLTIRSGFWIGTKSTDVSVTSHVPLASRSRRLGKEGGAYARYSLRFRCRVLSARYCTKENSEKNIGEFDCLIGQTDEPVSPGEEANGKY